MSSESKDHRTRAQLLEEIETLHWRLEEAEQTIEAIRKGDVDALVVTSPRGEQVFSITGAEHIYRVIVETMNEAGLTVDPDGTVLFCNQRFCDLMKTPIQEVIGHKVTAFAARPQQPSLESLLQDAQGEAVQRRVTLRAADGTAVPVQISASPLHTDNTVSICLVASDLTELEASAHSIRVLREHQQAVEESEVRFRVIFESSQDAVVIADNGGVYVQANPAVQAVFGLSPEELIGRRVSEFLREDIDFPAFWRNFLAAGSLREDMPLIRADGQVRYVESYSVANILPGRHLSVFHDITERKQAQEALLAANAQLQIQTEELRVQTEELRVANEELSAREEELRTTNEALRRSEERYRRLFDEDLTGDFLATPDGKVIECNPAFAEIYGFADREQAGQCDLSRFNPADWADLMAGLRAECRVQGHQCVHRRPDGLEIHVVANVIGRFNEAAEITEVQGYLYDNTERKRAEDALRELNATLESKVTQRTAELEHRARQLQRLTLELSEAEDRERKHLAEILHDDLQQILAAAKFHLNVLRSRAKYDPSVQATAAQVDHMLKDAIDKSRSLSHDLSPAILHHGDFGQTLRWLAGQVQAKHGLIVHVDASGEVDVKSEPLRAFLYKAAQELLFNVVKHARTTEAKIRVRRCGRCVCLSVSDRGRGFDPQELRETAGFGLLSIRERIELLGGRMRIKSAKGKGSKFYVVVPDAEIVGKGGTAERGPEGRVQEGESKPAARLRVLVADDHEIVREGLLSLLAEEHNIEVVGEAANGREAVDLAGRLRPDVVIMDVAMPLIEGDEATRQIKMHLPQTRVIALSMYGDEDSVERMRQAGAEAYVLKTAPSEELLAAIRGKR